VLSVIVVLPTVQFLAHAVFDVVVDDEIQLLVGEAVVLGDKAVDLIFILHLPPDQGLNVFSFISFMTLKCFALLETRGILFSTAVAAIRASPERMPDEEYILRCKLMPDALCFLTRVGR
jgi:hypothetical protein